MALKKRMAVTLPLNQVLQDTIDLVQWAEDNGYSDGWFADPGAPDSMTMAAAVGAHTKKLRIGLAIVPVYTRSPTVLAASTDVVAQTMPGRFILGLGSSSEIIMQNFNGIRLEKPLTRVKETAVVVRSILNGEKTNFTDLNTVYSRGYSQKPTEPPVPIYLAGLRPKMLEMAAEYGDGVILNLWPQSALPKMLKHIQAGAERGGKKVEDLEIVNRYAVIVTDDKTEGYERFRQHFIPYFSNPVYNNFLRWCGYEDEANEILEGWSARDRSRTAAAFHDDLVDQIGVVGSADECRERIQSHAQQGITTSIIAPPGRDLNAAYKTLDAFTAKNFRFE